MGKFDFKRHSDNLIFALALAVLITLIAYALSRRATEAAMIHVVFTQWWQEDSGDDTLRDLITEFESTHQGIRIILNTKSREDLRLELFKPSDFDQTEFAAQTSPQFAPQSAPQTILGDIIALDPLWIPELLERDVIESAEAAFTSFINILYFNIEILQRAGFTHPPRNREEFLNFARAVTAGGSVALGLSLGEDNPDSVFNNIYPWVWAAGAPIVTNGIPAVNSPQVIQTLAFFASLNDEGLIAANALSATSRDMVEDFISGRVAFMVASSKYLALVRERMGNDAFNITLVPAPGAHMGRRFSASTGWTVGIHSQTTSREEARLFSAFLAGRANVLTDNLGGMIPDSPSPDPFYSKIWEIALAGETAADFAAIGTENLLQAIFREEMMSLFAGNFTPAETAAAIQQRWLSVLAE